MTLRRHSLSKKHVILSFAMTLGRHSLSKKYVILSEARAKDLVPQEIARSFGFQPQDDMDGICFLVVTMPPGGHHEA
jgi:hypothetical protein